MLLDYPLHQYRLTSRLSEAFANYISSLKLTNMWLDNLPRLLDNGNVQTEVLHALSSSLKAFNGWASGEITSEARIACGGHGFSYYSLLGHLHDMSNIHQTWEGDNTVLLMQTQNFILKSTQKIMSGRIEAPETLEFISHSSDTLQPYEGKFDDIDAIELWLEQRACFLVLNAITMMMADPSKAKDIFSKYQAFDFRDMCLAYNELFCLKTFKEFVGKINHKETKAVYENLLLMYLLTRLNKHAGYAKGSEEDSKLKEAIMNLCQTLRPELVSLTDAFPFPNKMLGPLGNEDLDYVKRFYDHFMSQKDVKDRASWWKTSYVNADKAK